MRLWGSFDFERDVARFCELGVLTMLAEDIFTDREDHQAGFV